MTSVNSNIEQLKFVYFLGIGGIGMSAIARYFLAKGCEVFGYDKTATILTKQLENEGAKIHYNENINLIPNAVKEKNKHTLVVYTPAIPNINKEFQYFSKNNIKCHKRSAILGLISQNYFTIAVAGTHGKTTTSSIIAHILNENKIDCIAFLGGISLNFNSNLLLNKNAKIMVVEADEFDRSFLTLSPDIAIITSLDADHLDVYGNKEKMQNSYQEFVQKIKNKGTLITKNEFLPILKVNNNIKYKSYSINEQANCCTSSIKITNGNYILNINCESNNTKNIPIGLPGIHNVENAVGAFSVANELALTGNKIKAALASYKGVKRRFQYHVKTKNVVYIDDYAHHPTELEMTIKSVKELYPNKKITGIFQPHLFTRTRDFYNDFAQALSLLDELILLNIYPAREKPIAGITAKIIFDKVTCKEKTLINKDELMNYLNKNKYQVLLTLGAGDIDTFVSPIKKMITQSILKE